MTLSVSVLLICLYYNVKIKGLGGWIHELFAAPFGNHWALYPFNFAMQMIEFVAKTVSHGMRLFGNMYAGELIFMLIALMGAAWLVNAVILAGFSGPLSRLLGRRGLLAMERLMGMILVTISVQMIMTGIKKFLAS